MKSDLPESWEWVHLADVAAVVMGNSPPGTTYNSEGDGTPLLNGPSEFGPRHPSPVAWTTGPTRFARTGDVLFCVRGSTTGRMNRADDDYCIGRGLAAIRGGTGDDTNFIGAAISVGLPRLLTRATGSTFPSLSRRDLATFCLQWPPATERKVLAAMIGALDDKIESNRHLCGVLEDLVRVGASTPDNDAHAAPLHTLVTEHRNAVKDNELPYIGLDDMPRGSTVLCEWKTSGAPTGTSREFKRHDILFGKLRPYFRKAGVALIDGRCSSEIVVLRPRRPEYFGIVVATVASSSFIDHCVAVSTGTRMPRAEWSSAGEYGVAMPSHGRLLEINDLAAACYRRIGALVRESRTLARIRDELLPKLISGQIRVAV